MAHANVIELHRFGHLYRNGRGVREVDLEVRKGEIFGFLGPNGAGKTTLIRTMMGFLRPTTGSGKILGLDVVKDNLDIRKRVGYLPGEPVMYDWLTGRGNISLAMEVRGLKNGGRLRELAERLEADLDRKVKSLSKGNRQKIALLNAMVHDPELLILDEPTSGLDPLAQETVRAILVEEKARGKTVFMSSHDLYEVEAVADRVGIIRDGVLVAVDEISNLKKQRVKYVSIELRTPIEEIQLPPGSRVLRKDRAKLHLSYTGEVAVLLDWLSTCKPVDLTVADPPLEEVFRSFYDQEVRS
ncbi:MAG TPA: ABC transporter ATP-binding protein [Firmicutes bacterium]|nr:ABC transporter ATP-binding protein [Candidatus Fermentithermobacillaceae bacterium]